MIQKESITSETLPVIQPEKKSARRYLNKTEAEVLLVLQQSCSKLALLINLAILHGQTYYPAVDHPKDAKTVRTLIGEEIVYLVVTCKMLAVLRFIPYLPTRRLIRKDFSKYLESLAAVNNLTEDEVKTFKRNNW